MCGIVGIINQDKSKVTRGQLSRALQCIHHRGPDAQDIYTYNHVGLGNVRLAILDLDSRSNMPMHYAHLSITYNGEVYNYREIRTQLISHGYTFDTDGDTEVVLKAYHYWGIDCLDAFNGMWSFAILDKNENRIFCSRDRFGIKPFYYTEIGDTFCFASEIKAFTQISGWSATLNETTAFHYLVYGMQDYSRETLFDGVFQLPPSHYMTFALDTHRIDIKQYYHLQHREAKFTFTEAQDIFTSTFEESLRFRFRSDVKVGSCLSGGLDSSSIVAYSKDEIIEDSTFNTVSAVYPGTAIDESQYIQDLVSQKSITNISISPDLNTLMDEIGNLIWTQDEPFSSASIFAQNKVFEQAANHGLKVMLDGQGGDEILAGYDVFYMSHIKNLLRTKPMHGIMEFIHLAKNYQGSYARAIQTYTSRKQKTKGSKPTWIQINEPMDKPLTSDTSNVFKTSESLLFGMGIQALLHYEDRNSMAHSIESRLPFLDYNLVEFCLNLSSYHKIHKGRRKYILRESMKSYLPASIYHNLDKKGFETPQEVWMEEHRAKILSRISILADTYPYVNIDHLPQDYRVLWRIWCFLEWCAVFTVEHNQS